ncbi:MAG: hypothetical protein P8J79_05890 [Halioglobus sp.]|nr:hypothetical protein [Halioglobus sp.]
MSIPSSGHQEVCVKPEPSYVCQAKAQAGVWIAAGAEQAGGGVFVG